MFTNYDLGRTEFLAFQESTSRYTVGILIDGKSVGTGTLLQYERHRVVLTANHNLDGVSSLDELRFYFRPSGSIQEGSMSDFVGRRPMFLFKGDPVKLQGKVLRDLKND